MTSPESVADFSQVQLTALVELMLMAASADGVVSDIENRRIARNVEKSTNGAVGAETLQNMMTTAINRIDSGDRDSRLASIKKRLRAAAAVEGALDRVGHLMLASHVETRVASALESGKRS